MQPSSHTSISHRLAHAKTNREILKLALPAIVSNITTPLLGLIDTAITGHMGSPLYLAAIALGGSMFSLSYWLLNFLRVSTSGLTSQSFGAASGSIPSSPVALIFYRSLSLSLILAISLILVSPWLADLLIWFFDATPSTSAEARTYFLILIFGAPAVLSTFSLTGWLIGMQDTRTPMIMALITNLANIAASLILVYGLELKIEGVALGTLFAQYVGLISGWIITKRQYTFISHTLRHLDSFPTLFQCMERFMRLNRDIFLRTFCLVAVTLFFTRAGAKAGSDILAANAILMQLFILFSYFMDGFAFAGEAMAGKYFGAADHRMLKSTISGIFRFGLGVALIFTLGYAFLGSPILNLLTDEPQVVSIAKTYMPWAIAVPFVGTAAFVWDGIFIGLTLTRQMLISMFFATITFFILYFIFTPILGNHGLWLAFLSYLLARGLIQTIEWKNHKIENPSR